MWVELAGVEGGRGAGGEQRLGPGPQVLLVGEVQAVEIVHAASRRGVAEVMAFLLSDRVRAVNGAKIPVDGGRNTPSAYGY
ncbi:hypothetical protein [Streptomyces azureus]|uniref:Nitroreductase n=1 Tax=Streptomyces azureus TaxID=146537 RepID=A0A0K8PKL6_STRAJ|nr:hypothetical protein [Streptomyces azureus]GAP48303.1 nitroreductase [Streptomyces azureus]